MENITLQYIKTYIDQVKEILGPKLLGSYLHGSLATNFFDRNRSNVDLLFVTKSELTYEEKANLLEETLNFEKSGPDGGINLVCILDKYTKISCYPTPFVFKYSTKEKEILLADKDDFLNHSSGSSKELSLILLNVYQRGVVLSGNKIKVQFEKPNILYSIEYLSNKLKYANEDIIDAPIDISLNLIRTYYLFKDKKVYSKGESYYLFKDEVSNEFKNLLNNIGHSFINNAKIENEVKELKSFVSYMSKLISTFVF